MLAIVLRMAGWEQAIGSHRIWALSSGYEKLRKAGANAQVERVFQLHTPERWEEWIDKRLEERLVVMRPYGHVPKARVLPAGELVKAFGRVFTSSVSWMLGMALLEGETDIVIYGAPLTQDSEYYGERPALYYLMGFAASRGQRVRFIGPSYVSDELCRKLYEVEEPYGGIPNIAQ